MTMCFMSEGVQPFSLGPLIPWALHSQLRAWRFDLEAQCLADISIFYPSTAILPVTLSHNCFEAHLPTLTPVFGKGIRDSPKGRKIRWHRDKRATQVFPRTNLQRNLSWATPGGVFPKKTWGSIFLLGIRLGNESIRLLKDPVA